MANMISLRCVILVAVAIMPVSCDEESWKKDIEYFERVDLDCAKFNFNTDVIQSVQAWILPSGDVWKPGSALQGSHIVIRDNGFVLTIDRIDDDDFGVYYCIVGTGVNRTDVIKIGINVDGPYFGPSFMEEIKHNAMVGGIAGGCALVLLVILWFLCTYCTKAPLPPIIKNSPSSSEVLRGGQTNEEIKMTKIDDNLYYNADEVAVDVERTPNTSGDDVKHTETLSSTGSGDYHSIDSIDRNKKLQSLDPNDVYNNYVKSVHM